MQNLTIQVNSVIAPMIQGKLYQECSRINQLARKETVELHFFGEYVRITAHHTKKVKVPAKARKNGEALMVWMEERIMSAWK